MPSSEECKLVAALLPTFFLPASLSLWLNRPVEFWDLLLLLADLVCPTLPFLLTSHTAANTCGGGVRVFG